MPTAYVIGVAANYVSEMLLGFEVGSVTFLVGSQIRRFPAQLEVLSIPFLFLAWRMAPPGVLACAGHSWLSPSLGGCV